MGIALGPGVCRIKRLKMLSYNVHMGYNLLHTDLLQGFLLHVELPHPLSH